jgi:sugar lactone lactonase YvrE
MRTSLRLRVGAALLVAAGASAVAPGVAAAGHGYPPVVNGHAPALHPEGITYDPSRRAFLVGSLRHGTVSIVAPDGSATTLASDPRIPSTAGLHVDPVRGRILAAYGDIGVAVNSEPDPAKRRTGLAIFDLRTGAIRHLVQLAVGAGHLANDVAIDHAGNAYVTDSASDVIYRVDPAGRASEFVKDARFATTSFGINGLVWHPDGYLLVGKYDTGKLFTVSTRGRPVVNEVALDRPVVGADGLALRRDGSLIVVTNNAGAPDATDTLTVLRSGNGWRSARETRREVWPVNDPTTVALSPFGAYAVSGDITVLLGGSTSDTFTLRRL